LVEQFVDRNAQSFQRLVITVFRIKLNDVGTLALGGSTVTFGAVRGH